MAKFRQNHQSANNNSGGMITKVGIFAALMGGLFFVFNYFTGGSKEEESKEGEFSIEVERPKEEVFELELISDEMLPTSSSNEIIKRSYYVLSYSEEHEQAEWVAYKLTKASIQVPNVDRTNDFRPDPKVRKGSASPKDYYSTGYDRGHLVPAGDMAFSKRAMTETFYMSNISPQIRNFNGGIWRELEENVRNWAYRFNELYVVSGPVLNTGVRERIGGNKVAVPDQYFKVILDVSEPELKGIAFLIPNEISTKPLNEFAVSIDEVEKLTGIDFFYYYDTEAYESSFDLSLWEFDDKKYEKRLNNWNRRQ